MNAREVKDGPTELTTRLMPVARASFSLSDRSAFGDAVRLAIGWIENTAKAQMPPEAWQATSFEFDQQGALATVSAARLDDERGSVWAARTTFFGDRTASRRWTTDLFVESVQGDAARFGAQLMCQCEADDPGFNHSRPRVIKEVIDHLAAEADGETLSNSFNDVTESQVADLADLIYRKNRRLPILVVSTDYDGEAQVDLDRLANRVSGVAHLRKISIDPSFELTRTLGKRMSTYNGAIRLYLPGLAPENHDEFHHPLWFAPKSGWNPKVTELIAARVLPLGFRDLEGDSRFWRVGLLRQAASRAIAQDKKVSASEQKAAEISALRDELDVAKEAAETAESLMYDEAKKVDALEAQVARAEEENAGLRQRLRNLGSSWSSVGSTLDEEDVYSLFEGEPSLETSLNIISSVFPSRVVVLKDAYESARDSSTFRFKKKAFDLLWSLATEYWTKLNDGMSDVQARQCFGSSYAAKEKESLSKGGRQRRMFSYNGQALEMERHLKIGVADNKADTLRVHFEWLASEGKIVIGHCGEHLDF